MKDILLGEDNQVQINPITNDIIVGKSDGQNIKYNVIFAPGQLKMFPKFGCNMHQLINGKKITDTQKAIIYSNLKDDGYSVKDIYYDSNDKLIIEINE